MIEVDQHTKMSTNKLLIVSIIMAAVLSIGVTFYKTVILGDFQIISSEPEETETQEE